MKITELARHLVFIHKIYKVEIAGLSAEEIEPIRLEHCEDIDDLIADHLTNDYAESIGVEPMRDPVFSYTSLSDSGLDQIMGELEEAIKGEQDNGILN